MNKSYMITALTLLVFASLCSAQLINITLVKPLYGSSPTDGFDLEISTLQSTEECKYSNSPLLDYEDIDRMGNLFMNVNNHLHRIINFSDLAGTENSPRNIYIKCKTTLGIINENESKAITLNVDSTDPYFVESYALPKTVVEKLSTELFVLADDQVSCRYDNAYQDFGSMRYFFSTYYSEKPYETINGRLFAQKWSEQLNKTTSIKIDDMKNYTLYVSCMNKAGLYTNTSTVNFTVNLNTPNQIIDYGPSGIIGTKSVTMFIETNKKSVCYYGEEHKHKFPDEHTTMHRLTINDAEQKQHNIPVKCIYDLGGPDGFAAISFTIDSTPPQIISIISDNSTCYADKLQAEFMGEDNVEVVGYKYRIIDSKNKIVVDWKDSGPSAQERNLDLERNNIYYWSVKAIDIAGSESIESKSAGTNIYGENDTECKELFSTPPVVSINQNSLERWSSVSMVCVDKDGECVVEEFYVMQNNDPKCNSCYSCPYTTYISPVLVNTTATFCYRAFDNDGNEVSGEKLITVKQTSCTPFSDSCCIHTADGNCDPDCPAGEDPDCISTCMPPKEWCSEKKEKCDEDCDDDTIPNSWEKE
ncbi:MAG: hypothetical protein KKF44_05000, partial [Nanoarchaeota archaeon]|nr:hypothetical protein [Nanoarchaeota archaeon]